MEVKPGYKQTEVGVIPEDWGVSPLEEFTSFISYGFTNPMPTSESGIYMITAKDINRGRIQFGTARCTTKEAYRTLLTAKSRPKKGDLLLTKDGTLGRLALVDDRIVCINQSVAILRPNPKAVPLFLKVLLEAPEYQNRMLEDAGGSTIKHIYITIVNRMPVAVPSSKAEQEAIAGALSDADALIESLRQLLTKKRQIKNAAMQELLTGTTRLPGFSGKWKVKRLGKLGGFLKGSGVTRDESASGSLACVRYGELYTRHNDCIKSFYSWISREVAATATRLEQGDILFAGSGETKDEIGKCAAFVDDIEAYAGGDIVVLRSKKADPGFLGYYLNTGPINRQKASKGQGDAVVHISAAALADIQCALPCITEQTAIATILSDMDAEIAALEARLSKARQIKQGMMQELLTGRTRLV